MLSEPSQVPTIAQKLPFCLNTLADPPTNTEGSQMRAVVPNAPRDCTEQYAVQIWINDVGQITAVNLLLGGP